MADSPNSIYSSKPIIGLCNEADSDFGWKRIVVKGYTFSNGRPFFQRESPGRAYTWYVAGTGT